MLGEFFITPDGTEEDVSAVLLDWQIDRTSAPDTIIDYIVRNCGYIHCSIGRLIGKINLNRKAVSASAVTRLIYLVSDITNRQNMPISVCLGDNVTETFRSQDEILRRLTDLVDTIPIGRHSRFSRRRIRLDSLEMPIVFTRLIQSCEHEANPVQNPSVRRQLDVDLKRRYMQLRCHRSSGQLTLTKMASGYLYFDENWRSQAIGRPLAHFQDRAYSSLVLESYREAANSTDPIVEQLDVEVRPTRRLGFNASYFRMLLPLKQQEQEEAQILGVSLIYRHNAI